MIGSYVKIFGLILLIGRFSEAKIPNIIGGTNAAIKHFPYLVSIRYQGELLCAGSIISDRHILTAAHCMDDIDKDTLTVHSGTSSLEKQGDVHKVLAAHVHPDYDTNNEEDGYPHDIALLTLTEPIVFNKYQQKINLPSQDVKDFQVAYVIGWGRISRSSWDISNRLQKLRVALLPSDKCRSYITHKMNPEQVCSFRSTINGACNGDSGGPLVSHGEVVGIVSYGDAADCADGIPDIYTKVYSYVDFIKSVVKE